MPIVIRQCAECGADFEFRDFPSNAGKGKFCGRECQRKGRKTRSDKKPRRTHSCQCCGELFTEDRHREPPPMFCSRKCLGVSQRISRNEKRPQRADPTAEKAWARAVILRDRACIRCGATERLQAHHVESFADNEGLRYDVGNGVALCPVCHHAQHPDMSLRFFLNRGGRAVQRCVVCETAYVPGKTTQRTCSVSCGQRLRRTKD